MVTDLPPNLPGPVICSIQAAQEYGLPAAVLLSVAQAENGQVGLWVQNSNKSFDVGIMQFNTAYLASLKDYGITPEAVEVSGCYPFQLAAWRIANHLKNDNGDYWSKVANYHSKTPELNLKYRTRLLGFYKGWTEWLNNPSSPLPWRIKIENSTSRKVVLKKESKTKTSILSFEDYLHSKGY